jgi:hypothetical protein
MQFSAVVFFERFCLRPVGFLGVFLPVVQVEVCGRACGLFCSHCHESCLYLLVGFFWCLVYKDFDSSKKKKLNFAIKYIHMHSSDILRINCHSLKTGEPRSYILQYMSNTNETSNASDFGYCMLLVFHLMQ